MGAGVRGRGRWAAPALAAVMLLSAACPLLAQVPREVSVSPGPPAEPAAEDTAQSRNADLAGPAIGSSPTVTATADSPAAAVQVAPAGGPGSALAQAVLTVDQEALYRRSRWGQRAQMQLAAESRQVAADNDRAFATLVADEDALTAARATLSAEEFRSRAAAFDERVTAVRQERDAARQALAAGAERDRAVFYQSVAPILGRIMTERGALVVMDQRAVLISDDRIDVTAATIAAIDAELGDGAAILSTDDAAARQGNGSPPPAQPAPAQSDVGTAPDKDAQP